jgi:hypothetical protein
VAGGWCRKIFLAVRQGEVFFTWHPLIGLPGNRPSGFPCPALDLTRETRREAIDGDLGRLARPKTMLLTTAEHTFHCGRAPGVVPMALVIGGANRLGQVLYLLVDHIGLDPV